MTNASVEKVTQLLGKRFKVTVKGGRVFGGEFACLDKQGNLVLSRASELQGPEFVQERFIGMVMIPPEQREQVEAQVTPLEKMALLSLQERT